MLLFDMETACQNGDTEHIDETDGEREKAGPAHETQNKARTEMFRGPGQNCREAPPRDWTRTGGGARKKWGGKKLQAGGPRESEGERRGTLATGRRGKVDEQPGRACLFRSLEQAQREGGILGDVDGFGRWILDAGLGRPGETLAGRRAAAADAASEPPVRYAYGMRTVPGNSVTAEQQQRLDLPSITS